MLRSGPGGDHARCNSNPARGCRHRPRRVWPCRDGGAGGVAGAAGDGDGAVHRGRHHRRAGAADGGAAAGDVETALHRRERARRRRRHRGGARAKGGARRLHAAVHAGVPDHHGAVHHRGDLRSGERLQAGDDRRHEPVRRHGGRRGAGDDASRVHRLCEGAARRGAVRLGRHRQPQPRVGGNLPQERRPRHGARALSRPRLRLHRPHRRPSCRW